MADQIKEKSLAAVRNITAVIGETDHAIWTEEARTQAYQRKTKELRDKIKEIKKHTNELKEDNAVKERHLEQVKLTNEVHRSLSLLLRNTASHLIEMKYVKEQRDSLLEEKYNAILEERQGKFRALRTELLASNEQYQNLRGLQVDKRVLSIALMDYRVRVEHLHRQLRVKEEVDGKVFRVRIVKFAEAVVERRVCERLHSELKKHELLEKNLVMELLDLQGQLNEKKKSSNSAKKMSTPLPTINFELPPLTSSIQCEKKLSFKEKLMKIAEFSKIDMFPSINKPPAPATIHHVAEKLQITAPAEKPAIKQTEPPVIRAAKPEDAQRGSRGNKIKIIDVSTVKPQRASQEPKPAKRPIPEKYLKEVRKKSLRNPSMCSVTTEDLNRSQCSQTSLTGPPTSREDIRKFISNIKSMKSGGKKQMSDEKKPFKSCLKLSQEKSEITVASQPKSETVVQVQNAPEPLISDAGDVKISEKKEEAGKSKTEEVKIKSDTMNDKLKSLFARKRPAEAEVCLTLKTPAVQSEEKMKPPPPKSVRFAESGESSNKSADQLSTFQSKSSEFTFASTAEADTSNYSPHFEHAGFSPERPFLTSPPSNFMFGTDSEADNEEAGDKFLFGGSATRSGFSLFPNP